jgi:hypothetical protein
MRQPTPSELLAAFAALNQQLRDELELAHTDAADGDLLNLLARVAHMGRVCTVAITSIAKLAKK